jgi:hypothetical protein
MSAEISFRIAPLLVPISKRPDPDFGQDSDSAGSRCECAGQQDLPHPRRQPRRRRRIGCRLRYGPAMWQNHIWIEIWRRGAAQPRISLRILVDSLTSRLRRYAHVVVGICLAPDEALFASVRAVVAATRRARRGLAVIGLGLRAGNRSDADKIGGVRLSPYISRGATGCGR